MKQTKKQQKEN